MMLIKNNFGFNLFTRYAHEIVYNEKNSDYVLYRTNRNIKKFEKHYQTNKPFFYALNGYTIC